MKSINKMTNEEIKTIIGLWKERMRENPLIIFDDTTCTEIVRCKDCKHRPRITDEGTFTGFDIEFPDYECPCRCEDGYYNWYPKDEWFCGNGERK